MVEPGLKTAFQISLTIRNGALRVRHKRQLRVDLDFGSRFWGCQRAVHVAFSDVRLLQDSVFELLLGVVRGEEEGGGLDILGKENDDL